MLVSMTRILPRWLAAVGVLAVGLAPERSAGQQPQAYRIGAGDVVSITFWQQPNLNQAAVLVRQDGIIAVPVIGEIDVAGLTPEEVSDRIVQRISRYIGEISQALVQVVAFNAREIFVTGQVNLPGRHTFEVLPDLWTAIRRAGGPTESADLAKVTVVDPTGSSSLVDLKSLLAEGKAETLPVLESGTTVDVPRRLDFLPPDIYGAEARELKPVVYVTGQVVQPGPKPIEGDIYIYDALALAGGLGPGANPSKVQVISKAPGGPVSQTLNLRPEVGNRAGLRYKIRYEDVIIVEPKGGTFWTSFRDAVTVVTSISTVVLLVDRFSR